MGDAIMRRGALILKEKWAIPRGGRCGNWSAKSSPLWFRTLYKAASGVIGGVLGAGRP